jgi:hypothetical protein
VGRGGGLLVVTLETIGGGAGTRRQWQQHRLDFARMMALPLDAECCPLLLRCTNIPRYWNRAAGALPFGNLECPKPMF